MSASDFYRSQFNRLVENYRFDMKRRIVNLENAAVRAKDRGEDKLAAIHDERASYYKKALAIFDAHVEEVTSPAVAKRENTLTGNGIITRRNGIDIVIPGEEPKNAAEFAEQAGPFIRLDFPDTITEQIDVRELVNSLPQPPLTVKAPQ